MENLLIMDCNNTKCSCVDECPNTSEIPEQVENCANVQDNSYFSCENNINEEDNFNNYSTMTNEEIGVFVKNSRKKKDWTQEDLANEAGVARRTVIRIEKGMSINMDNLRAILKLFGKDIGISKK